MAGSRNLGALTLDMIVRTGKWNAGFKESEKRVSAWSKGIHKVLGEVQGQLKGALAGLAVGAIVGKIIQETTELETAVRQVEARLKSTNAVVGISSRELQKMAEQMQLVTTYTDDAILSMQSVLLTFTNIRGERFEEATQAVLDLSVAMGQDLQSSAVQVGKALNDPVKGITALQRVGVAFSAKQKELIQSFVDAGDRASAQAEILKELRTEFGGAAAAAGNTLGGALTQLKNAFDDLFEAQSGTNDLTQSIQELTTLLRDPETAAAFQAVASLIIKALKNITDTIVFVGKAITWLTTNFEKAFGGKAVIYVLKEFQLIGTELEKIRDDIEFLEGGLQGPFPGILTWKGELLDTEEILDRIKQKRLEEARELYRLQGSTGPRRRPTPASLRAEPGDPEAIKDLEKVRDGLRQQIATFDQAAAAVMRYRIAQGDLAEAFRKSRADGEALKGQLIELAAVAEQQQLRKQIKDQTDQLRDQAATLGMNAEQTMRYRVTQGDLAETFQKMGEAGRYAAAALIASAGATERAVNAFNIDEMRKDLRDQIATFGQGEAAVLAYRIAIGDLRYTFDNTTEAGKKMARQIIDLTLQLQLMKDIAESVDDTVDDMSESLNESLEKFSDDFEKRFLEKRDVLLEFMEGFAQGTENIIADALESGFEGGARGILKSFGALLQRLIAQAIAADLAKRIFGEVAGGTGTGWLGALAGIFGVKAKASGGPVMAGMPYLVGERGPEIIVPSRSSTVIPNHRIGGQNNYINVTVQTPTGRVPMETQQQLGNRVARALGDARRRNG